jgi:hypothetical protein
MTLSGSLVIGNIYPLSVGSNPISQINIRSRMNLIKRFVLAVSVLMLTVQLLFPPWVRTIPRRGEEFLGYHFWAEKMPSLSSIDSNQMLVNLLYTLLILAGLYLLVGTLNLRSRKNELEGAAPLSDSQNKQETLVDNPAKAITEESKTSKIAQQNKRYYFPAVFLISYAFVIWVKTSYASTGLSFAGVGFAEYLKQSLANQRLLAQDIGNLLFLTGAPYLLAHFITWLEKIWRKSSHFAVDTLLPETGPRPSVFVAIWLSFCLFWFLGVTAPQS